jgi:outer membrane receptor protein involved in Fe transport
MKGFCPASLVTLALLAVRGAAHEPPAAMEPLVVTGKAESLIGEAGTASQGHANAEELNSRPILRRGELLETVPGVVITQHSGDGKANQYFVRGFNLDHGTDFAITMDGQPVNFVTHAHGQGYADLNPIIPELVEGLEYWKGPFFAQLGDLSTAGGAKFRFYDRLPQGIASFGIGEDNFYRALLADTVELGKSSPDSDCISALTYALEWFPQVFPSIRQRHLFRHRHGLRRSMGLHRPDPEAAG